MLFLLVFVKHKIMDSKDDMSVLLSSFFIFSSFLFFFFLSATFSFPFLLQSSYSFFFLQYHIILLFISSFINFHTRVFISPPFLYFLYIFKLLFIFRYIILPLLSTILIFQFLSLHSHISPSLALVYLPFLISSRYSHIFLLSIFSLFHFHVYLLFLLHFDLSSSIFSSFFILA